MCVCVCVYRPESFYTCESPQLSNGSNDDEIGICQEVFFFNKGEVTNNFLMYNSLGSSFMKMSRQHRSTALFWMGLSVLVTSLLLKTTSLVFGEKSGKHVAVVVGS